MKSFKIVPTIKKIDAQIIYTLFNKENTIYISREAVKSKTAFIWRNGSLYYPFLLKGVETFTPCDMTIEQIFTYITRPTTPGSKHHGINSWDKLFGICRTSCGIGIFDINSDYRYTVFENIKRLIVDQQIETTLSPFDDNDEYVIISVSAFIL